MLEQGDVLRTWRLSAPAFQAPQVARQIKDHRKSYLDYEGEISDDRGRVKIHDTGTFTVDFWTDDRIQVALAGRVVKARLLLTLGSKHPEDSDPRWNVADATQEIRKAAAALLREAALDEAPSAELADLREALTREERKIMSLVDLYARGGGLEWNAVSFDPDVRKRVESEKARWQHPWLAAAKSHADKLSSLADLLKASKPK